MEVYTPGVYGDVPACNWCGGPNMMLLMVSLCRTLEMMQNDVRTTTGLGARRVVYAFGPKTVLVKLTFLGFPSKLGFRSVGMAGLGWAGLMLTSLQLAHIRDATLMFGMISREDDQERIGKRS